MTKPKFIILEGVDRSGKDSMQDAIDKATRYKHIITDRGPIGFQAYCEIFNKPEELFLAYQSMEHQLLELDNVLVIYIDCSNAELIARCVRTNHEILDFRKHKRVYEKYVKNSKLNKIVVDTTFKHVDEIVKELIDGGVL